MILDDNIDIEQLQGQISALNERMAAFEKLYATISDIVGKEGDYYDKKLGDKIKVAIDGMAAKFPKSQEIDFSPLIKVVSEISAQNKRIIELMPKQSPDVTPLIIQLINKQNQIIERTISKEIKQESKPEWNFEINRDSMSDKIISVTAKPK